MPSPQIILISAEPVFNKEFIMPLGILSIEDTSILKYTLINNFRDNIDKITSDHEFVLFLNQNDQDNLPQDFNFSEIRFFNPGTYYKEISEYILKKFHKGNNQFILLFAHSIGFSPNEYNKIINLLNYDDNAIVLCKSLDDRISMIAFNYFDDRLFQKITELNPLSETFLKRVNTLDYYVFMLDGYTFINTMDDFKLLYKMLSKKESIEYCSHEIHEQFTHLFIEYKESLK